MACGKVLAVPGRTLGVHSQLWQVRALVAAGAILRLEEWHPADPADLPAWEPAAEAELVPSLIMLQGGKLVWLAADRAAIVDRSAVHETWRLEVHRDGWHMVAWETRWRDQVAVDVQGYVTWSDPRSSAWWLDDVAIGIAWPVKAQLHGALRQGLV